MNEIIKIIHKSIDIGLSGTNYANRILQQQSHLIGKAEKQGRIGESVVNQIIENVTALMESKKVSTMVMASSGVILHSSDKDWISSLLFIDSRKVVKKECQNFIKQFQTVL